MKTVMNTDQNKPLIDKPVYKQFLNKTMTQKEEFEELFVDYVYLSSPKDHTNAWKNIEGFTKTPQELYQWHIQQQIKLLEEVKKEFEEIYDPGIFENKLNSKITNLKGEL